VGLVAKEIISRQPKRIQELLFPNGVELVAASHDIGKLNPHFQEKIRRTLPDYEHNSVPFLNLADPSIEKPHSEVSQVALKSICKNDYIAEIVGMHHGTAPSSSVLLAEDEVIGGNSWQSIRVDLVNSLKTKLKQGWPSIVDNNQALAIAGLTTVSDWIASGSNFENLQNLGEENIYEKVKFAVDDAGFVTPKTIKNLDFREIFSPYTPLQVQKLLYEQVDLPGVYIFESIMGSGKTEAAFYSAYKLLEKGVANGIYFALPSKITSEKIFDRMEKFLEKILNVDDKHKLLLTHGDAWLKETELGEDARPGYSWFDSRKRKLLAPFAVGTLDQVLMSVMNVKHSFVRTYGLVGKVVILDEVHSYDSYTGTIMDFLIDSLLSLGSSVILLSATLTADRKTAFLQLKDNSNKPSLYPLEYPLLTKHTAEGLHLNSIHTDYGRTEVFISIQNDIEKTIQLARKKAKNGEYVLWIENTVQEAQDVFKLFATWGKENKIEVGLIHSRFPIYQRDINESYWVGIFGKDNKNNRATEGKILIGTQVLEQSLDLDADILISKIAPTDMILQRIGRLWRHPDLNTVRPTSARCEVIIIAPPLEVIEKNPEFAYGPSGYVYSPYVLTRSLLTLMNYQSISIPEDMRPLIEATYEDRVESNSLLNIEKHKLIKSKEKLRTFALQTLSGVGKSFSDNAVTRYSEVPSCDVLLLLSNSDLSKGQLFFIDGSSLFLPIDTFISKKQKKEIAITCMEKVITVPIHLAPVALSISELSNLKKFLYIAENEEERLRIAILNQSGRIEGFYGKEANYTYCLEYSQQLGYSTAKKEMK